MENDISLFEAYFMGTLSESGKEEFEKRLAEDREFADDFRLYLRIVKGFRAMAGEEDMELGIAMKALSRQDMERIVGHPIRRVRKGWSVSRAALGWWSAAAVVVVAFVLFGALMVNYEPKTRLDKAIVAYNEIPAADRGSEAEITAKTPEDRIESLRRTFDRLTHDRGLAAVSPENVQEVQQVGLALAISYIEVHDRASARAMLESLIEAYPDDPYFTGQCRRILELIE